MCVDKKSTKKTTDPVQKERHKTIFPAGFVVRGEEEEEEEWIKNTLKL